MSRLAFCLLLVCVSATVGAREVRLLDANGESGTCPEIASAVAAADERAKPRNTTAPATAREAKAGKPTVRGDAGARQPLRWHSFLPGMFR